MSKEQEIMQFLHERVFDPVLNSPNASENLKQRVRLIIVRMEQSDCIGMAYDFLSAATGTEGSVGLAEMLKDEGFNQSEAAIDEFYKKFRDLYLT